MGLNQDFILESFDDLADLFQEEENSRKVSKTYKDVINPKKYFTSKKPRIITIEEYNQKVTMGIIKPQNETEHVEKNQADTVKKDKAKKILRFPTGIAKKKESKEDYKETSEEKKAKKRKIKEISKSVQKNVRKVTRFTEPKKRNLLRRIMLQQALANGTYDDIEEGYDNILQEEIDDSKNAKKKADRRFYREVQEYEDAVDDVTLRKGWNRFKVGLATLLLITSIGAIGYTIKEINDTLTPETQIISVETMDSEQKDYYHDVINEFTKNVKNKDGYEFDFLSNEELINGYIKIIEKEKKMHEAIFDSALYKLEDQELLDEIVEKSLGDEYGMLSNDQKRDYRQLAFELLPISRPELFGNGVSSIRNPIVVDELQTKNSSKAKGYHYTIVVNSDEKENVRNIGRLIHIKNQLTESDFILASQEKHGQELLEDMVRQALEEQYENTSQKEIRDYIQIAYELLPDNAKEKYIKDPIDIEKLQNDLELGE